MIKNLFLNYKGKPAQSSKEHPTYTESTTFGILYNADEFDGNALSDLKQSLEQDSKVVSLMGFTENPNEDVNLFCKKDISATGAIKKEHLNFFSQQTFDFLISLDTSENLNYKYILAICKATCKVGIEAEQYFDLLQLALRKESDNNTALRNLVKYLKMI